MNSTIQWFSDQISAETIEQFVDWAPQVGASILIFILFWTLGIAVKYSINRFAKHTNAQRAQVIQLLASFSRAAITIIGIITALGSMGVNVNALVASVGLSSFALSFALKDALSNFLAGIMLFIYQPFKVGDEVALGSTQGKVVRLTLRYVFLKNETKTYMVPNSSLLTNTISLFDSPSS